MEVVLDFGNKNANTPVRVLSAFCQTKADKNKKEVQTLVNSHWPKEVKDQFSLICAGGSFKGGGGESFQFTSLEGQLLHIVGLGKKEKKPEALRRSIAGFIRRPDVCSQEAISLDLDGFKLAGDLSSTVEVITEAIYMAVYNYDKYLKGPTPRLKTVYLSTKDRSTKKAVDALADGKRSAECVNVTRTLINHPPNFLHSVQFAKEVETDVKKNLKGVRVKILGKAELKKEKCNMFLSVNAGSAHEPKLVHLTYTPKIKKRGSKHIALVGKGLTFDTGGYSLKPANSMVNMKFDMGGAATVYGAFRSAVLAGSPHKLTLILGITDNAVNEHATMPDSIVTARNGKTVEILNTDAEGRLVLGDCLDYACDQKPDEIIDAATLTGACLIAVGSECCAVLGNHEPLVKSLLKSAKAQDENMWQLPILDEYRNDMKGKISDLRNIGSNRFAGTAKAAAFLENFVREEVKWAHLDIAGIGDTQAYLPYCPNKGASGLIVRTVANYLVNG